MVKTKTDETRTDIRLLKKLKISFFVNEGITRRYLQRILGQFLKAIQTLFLLHDALLPRRYYSNTSSQITPPLPLGEM